MQLLVALVALVPFVIVCSWALFWLFPQTREGIVNHHREMADSVLFQVADHLQGAERTLLSLTDYIAPQLGASPGEISAILDSHIGGGNLFTAIYAADAEDMVFAVGLPALQRKRRPDLLGIDLSRRSFIRDVRMLGVASWSNNFLSTVSGKLAVAFAVPLPGGILIGEVGIDRLTSYVRGLPSRSRLITVVLDGRGQVIAYSRKDFAGQQLELGDQERLNAPLLSGLGLRSFSLAGQDYLGTVAEIPRLDWKVVVAQVKGEALKPLHSIFWVLGAGILGALLMALGTGWLLARGLASDFAGLADQARSVADGEYDRPLPDSGIKEFADLAADLQKMSDAIGQRETALAESEARLIKAQSVAHVGNWEIDLNDRLIWGSQEAFNIYGLPASQSRIMDLDLVKRIPLEEERERLDQALQNLINDGAVYDLEFRIRRPSDGELRHVHSKAEVMLAPDGTPAKVIGTIQDITERKKLEEQLFQSQKLEAIGMLAGGVAHDFNNMLGVILGYTELLRLQMEPDSPFFKKLEAIENAAIHSRDIIRQLLAFSRKQIISPKPQNLNQLIEGTIKTLHRLIGEDVSLSFHPSPELWLVKMDPSQMDQILVNLAVNARDAMPHGGKLLMEVENVVLDDNFCHYHPECQPGNHVMLAVSDTGMGMDQAIRARIFEPFFTTKEVGKGTGLGLATVYGIVKQNGGFISVYSEPDRGTTFKVYLPRHLGESETLQTEATVPPRTGQGNVMLVEDDDLVRQVAASMLEELGYQVVSFKMPSEARDQFRRVDNSFDLLITDVIMPEMSGKELYEAINDLVPGIKVLFMSGYTSDVIVHHGVLDEGVHFLPKPFNLNDLAKKVSEAMA